MPTYLLTYFSCSVLGTQGWTPEKGTTNWNHFSEVESQTIEEVFYFY